MGQREVIEYLNTQRLQGYNGFFTVNELAKSLDVRRDTMYVTIKKLLNSQIVERNIPFGWSFAVRLRRKYINREKSYNTTSTSLRPSNIPISAYKEEQYYPEYEHYD